MASKSSDRVPPLRSNGKPDRRAGRKTSFYRPVMVVIAITMFWGALHEPDVFDAGTIAVWALGAVTVALLARAGLALFEPSIRLVITLLLLAIERSRTEVEEP